MRSLIAFMALLWSMQKRRSALGLLTPEAMADHLANNQITASQVSPDTNAIKDNAALTADLAMLRMRVETIERVCGIRVNHG